MSGIRVLNVKTDILKENEKEAEALRESLREKHTLLINLMGSPGAGKTTCLERLIEALRGELKIAVMEADIDSAVDAERIKRAGVHVVQLHTGGMCHLDAVMTAQGLEALGDERYDLVVLENVGNLVCPAEFDTGAHVNIAVLSVPEGDDKPLKYPLMFEVCDLVLVNKTDTMALFDFDLEAFTHNAGMRHPGIRVLPVCAKTGEGIEALAQWVKERRRNGFI